MLDLTVSIKYIGLYIAPARRINLNDPICSELAFYILKNPVVNAGCERLDIFGAYKLVYVIQNILCRKRLTGICKTRMSLSLNIIDVVSDTTNSAELVFIKPKEKINATIPIVIIFRTFFSL